MSGLRYIGEGALELVAEDTAAFDAVMDAVRMRKAQEAQRALLSNGALTATPVPLETPTMARLPLQLASLLTGSANPRAASELGATVPLARAGAPLNMAMYLSALPKGAVVDG